MVCYTAAVQHHGKRSASLSGPFPPPPPPPPLANFQKKHFFDKHCVSDWPQSGVDRREQRSNWFCIVKRKKRANLVGLLFYSKVGMKIKGATTANNRWATNQTGSVADTLVLGRIPARVSAYTTTIFILGLRTFLSHSR